MEIQVGNTTKSENTYGPELNYQYTTGSPSGWTTQIFLDRLETYVLDIVHSLSDSSLKISELYFRADSVRSCKNY